MGNVLLSVNPYKKLLIYSPEVIDVYRCHCLHQLPPHMCVRESKGSLVADNCQLTLMTFVFQICCDRSGVEEPSGDEL